jgi:hypothetical protein
MPAANYNSNITHRTSTGLHHKSHSNISNLNPNNIGLLKSPYKGSDLQLDQKPKVSPSQTNNLTLTVGRDGCCEPEGYERSGIAKAINFCSGNNSFNNSFVKDR